MESGQMAAESIENGNRKAKWKRRRGRRSIEEFNKYMETENNSIYTS